MEGDEKETGSAARRIALVTEVVVPEPVETAPEGKQKAVYVDSQTAVKVLNRRMVPFRGVLYSSILVGREAKTNWHACF